MKKRLIKWAKVSAVVVLVPFLALLGFAGLYAFEKPGEPVDYSSLMNELARAAQPGQETEPNRFEFLKTLVEDARAARESVIADDEFYVPEILAYRGPEELAWNYGESTAEYYEEQLARARSHITALREAGVFDRLEELPSIRHAYTDIAQPVEDCDTPSNLEWLLLLYSSIRDLSDTLVSLALDRARNGEVNRALDLLTQTKALARLTSYHGITSAMVTGEGIDMLVAEHVMVVLLEQDVEPQQLDRMRRMQDEQQLSPLEFILSIQRLERDEFLQYVFTDDGQGDGIIAMSAMWGMGFTGTPFEHLPNYTIFNVAGLALPSRNEFESMIDLYEIDIREAAADFRRPVPEFKEYYDLIHKGIFYTPFVSQIVDFESKYVEIYRKRIATEHGLRIALALEGFFNDAGMYPDSLDQLVPEHLDVLPVDPWNPSNTLTYRPPAEGEAYYTLYSFGYNAHDDQGEGDDHRLSPPWRLVEN